MPERTIEYEDDAAYVPQADFVDTLSAQEVPVATGVARRRTSLLRRELSARNLQRSTAFAHEATYGKTPSVVYQQAEDETHGNFYPASYRRILAKPAWAQRLQKAYSASHRIAYAGARERHELDCANSSDALLMNIFCHPAAMRSRPLQALLGVRGRARPEFGVRARVPLRDGHDDRTELDLRLSTDDGDLLVEAKLSETDFQTAKPELLQRYAGFEETFAVELLPRAGRHFRSYQLLRSVLAARHLQAGFAILLDARRSDLVEDAFQVFRTVHDAALRSRLHVITWQEIAACVPRKLQIFLGEKYGIDAAR